MTSNWKDRAACRGLDTELWFSEWVDEALAAKTICAGCPVAFPCLDDAIATDESIAYGIRAGLTGRQRTKARLDRARAAAA